MASVVYWSALIVIVLAVLTAGATDFTLWLMGEQTISAYLRMHPAAFWWPVAVATLLFAALALHLFVLWK